jgi:hypothetical protein
MEITIKSLEEDVTEKQVKYFPDFVRKGDLSAPAIHSRAFPWFLVPEFSSPTAEMWEGGGGLCLIFICINYIMNVFFLYR